MSRRHRDGLRSHFSTAGRRVGRGSMNCGPGSTRHITAGRHHAVGRSSMKADPAAVQCINIYRLIGPVDNVTIYCATRARQNRSDLLRYRDREGAARTVTGSRRPVRILCQIIYYPQITQIFADYIYSPGNIMAHRHDSLKINHESHERGSTREPQSTEKIPDTYGFRNQGIGKWGVGLCSKEMMPPGWHPAAGLCRPPIRVDSGGLFGNAYYPGFTRVWGR